MKNLVYTYRKVKYVKVEIRCLKLKPSNQVLVLVRTQLKQQLNHLMLHRANGTVQPWHCATKNTNHTLSLIRWVQLAYWTELASCLPVSRTESPKAYFTRPRSNSRGTSIFVSSQFNQQTYGVGVTRCASKMQGSVAMGSSGLLYPGSGRPTGTQMMTISFQSICSLWKTMYRKSQLENTYHITIINHKVSQQIRKTIKYIIYTASHRAIR